MIEFWDFIKDIYNSFDGFLDMALEFVKDFYNLTTSTISTLSNSLIYIAPPFNIIFGSLLTILGGYIVYKLVRG